MTIKKVCVGPRGKVERFFLMEGENTVAWFDDFTTAAIVSRFIKAGRLDKPEYDRAVAAMNAFDGRGEEVADPE